MKLFEPGKIGSLSIKNRIMRPALIRGLMEPDGRLSQRAIDYYVARAKGGAGLITVSVNVSRELFDIVQVAMKKNCGRSETLAQRPERQYLLKGIIRCACCGMPMWAEAYITSAECESSAAGVSSFCRGLSGSIWRRTSP